MSSNPNINISTEQAKAIAFIIVHDIKGFIEQHKQEYEKFLEEEKEAGETA